MLLVEPRALDAHLGPVGRARGNAALRLVADSTAAAAGRARERERRRRSASRAAGPSPPSSRRTGTGAYEQSLLDLHRQDLARAGRRRRRARRRRGSARPGARVEGVVDLLHAGLGMEPQRDVRSRAGCGATGDGRRAAGLVRRDLVDAALRGESRFVSECCAPVERELVAEARRPRPRRRAACRRCTIVSRNGLLVDARSGARPVTDAEPQPARAATSAAAAISRRIRRPRRPRARRRARRAGAAAAAARAGRASPRAPPGASASSSS